MSQNKETPVSAAAPKESGSSMERKEHTGSSETLKQVAQVVGEAGEAAEGVSVMAEKVSESVSESAGEQGGSGAKTGHQGDDDDDFTQGDDSALVFDDNSLPAQDAMIVQIEKQIRKDIKRLEKEADRYRGNLLRNPDYQKLNDAVSEIRLKRKLLSELAHLAYDALKNLYWSLFKQKEVK